MKFSVTASNFAARLGRTIATGALAATLTFAVSAGAHLATSAGLMSPQVAIAVGAVQAEAGPKRRQVRRTVRRTVRRAHRRAAYLRALPAGCVVSVLNNVRYWRCASIYYRQDIRDGATVYVVVNP